MEGARIQISIRLLEKLAGVPPEEQTQPRRAAQQQHQQQQRSPGLGGGPPGLAGGLAGGVPLLQRLQLPQPGELGPPAFSLEPEVRGALAASRRVGGLLLKAEEGEMAAVRAAADELIAREHSTPMRAVPCGAQRDAVVDCYQAHKQEAWRCAGLVDAYAACSAAAYDSLTS